MMDCNLVETGGQCTKQGYLKGQDRRRLSVRGSGEPDHSR